LVETIDIFPTLTDLCGLQTPSSLDGRSLRPWLDRPATPTAKPARSFWTGGQRTVRTEQWRMIATPVEGAASPQVELFDYKSDPGETKNHAAAQPEVVKELQAQLNQRPRLTEPEGKAAKKKKKAAAANP
jgi:iduronate 2-sulfatase